MTLRQDQFIKKLPENGFNISKTMRDVGYTVQSSKAGSAYNSLRARIEQAFSKEGVQAKILKAEKKFLKDGDNANYARMIELQAKASGLTKDSAGQQVAIFTNSTEDKAKRILEQVQDAKPVDNPVDTQVGHSDKAV